MSNMIAPRTPRLTLGPLLFNWPAEKKRDFYFRIADEAPIDAVYLGEVVCAKRAPFFDDHLPEVAERLCAAGKEVVFSGLALVSSARELESLQALAETDDGLVEANDLSLVALLGGRPHVVGPFVSLYNEGALAVMKRAGARRVVLPAELPAAAIATLARSGSGLELEVQVFGRLPLAISARCYHARSHGLHKDGCLYVCGEDPDGITLETLEGTPFLAVNGTQTLSHKVCNLVGELPALAALGVSHLRLWPHDIDMVAVAEVFRRALEGRLDGTAALERLRAAVPFASFANGYYYGHEGARFTACREAAARPD